MKPTLTKLAVSIAAMLTVLAPAGRAWATGGPHGTLAVSCELSSTSGQAIFSGGNVQTQSFIAPWGTASQYRSGKLLSLQLDHVYRDAGPATGDILVEIRYDSEATIDPVIGSTVIPDSEVPVGGPTTVTADFDPATAPYLSGGGGYTFEVSTDDDAQNSFMIEDGDPCPVGAPSWVGSLRGPSYWEEGWDAGFRVYLGPQNDDFARASAVQAWPENPVGQIPGTTVGGTRQANEPYHCNLGADCNADPRRGGNSVWYKWTALGSGPATFDTCTAEIDSVLAVYTGRGISGLTKVADNNDHDGSCLGTWPYGSIVTFDATAGTTYRVAVADVEGARESTFTLGFNVPANESPTVTHVRPEPDSRIRDRTPLITAKVSDSASELTYVYSNFHLKIDGNYISRKRYSYNSTTDKFSFQSRKLSFGRHTVHITARDHQALAGGREWAFRVVRG